jgi:heptosyltransferase-2
MTTVPHGQSPGPSTPRQRGDVGRLVIFAPNWLGDVVMALPAIADVCRTLPGGVVRVAARPSVAPLFAMVSGIGDVVTLRSGGAAGGAAAAALREGRFDSALLLPNSMHAALVAWRADIAERWGYRTDWRGPLLTRGVPQPRRGHTAEYFQHLVRELGFPSGPLEPRLEVPEASRDAGVTLLSQEGWDGRRPLVAIAPGAAYGASKRWPPESFAAVADALTREGAAVAMIGSASDRKAGREVLDALPNGAGVIDLMGRTDLLSLAGVLSSCRALVANDSGAAHVGAALGIGVTAMYGPFPESENRPLGRPEPAVLTHRVWCRPCLLRECPIDHRCLRGISVEAVLTAARRSL